ncbi:predicted protein [Pyrenophora tritici-repentis Pt-1C-BFP]|uniref:Uncharacterized protein n=1 Tax=Pyrenophora tritici-repentis (strain Pt-1C-BFP) TaxID=426418 RepID=B2WE76_PYRTR|nr:uncharacterized protein PTRG_08449 [Pyrenophora tritici-repentis Pt-1C-BFP]EDU51368.1 predicted protein [Pyrenophora tritici-repentis Pt-1C-BFP]
MSQIAVWITYRSGSGSCNFKENPDSDLVLIDEHITQQCLECQPESESDIVGEWRCQSRFRKTTNHVHLEPHGPDPESVLSSSLLLNVGESGDAGAGSH